MKTQTDALIFSPFSPGSTLKYLKNILYEIFWYFLYWLGNKDKPTGTYYKSAIIQCFDVFVQG